MARRGTGQHPCGSGQVSCRGISLALRESARKCTHGPAIWPGLCQTTLQLKPYVRKASSAGAICQEVGGVTGVRES